MHTDADTPMSGLFLDAEVSMIAKVCAQAELCFPLGPCEFLPWEYSPTSVDANPRARVHMVFPTGSYREVEIDDRLRALRQLFVRAGWRAPPRRTAPPGAAEAAAAFWAARLPSAGALQAAPGASLPHPAHLARSNSWGALVSGAMSAKKAQRHCPNGGRLALGAG